VLQAVKAASSSGGGYHHQHQQKKERKKKIKVNYNRIFVGQIFIHLNIICIG